MANKLFFDVESLPAPESKRETLKYLYDKKVAKIPEGSDRTPETFEEFLDKTSFDGAYGRICCISLAINDEPVRTLSGPDNEAEVLEDFWGISAGADMFIGHNIRDFDLPFIVQRSMVLGVKPSWNRFQELGKKPWEMSKHLDFARYKNIPIFDTMWEWSHWTDRWNNKGLEHIALALGIPTPKDGIDGSQVAEFYKQGKLKEICDYCERDVETTRAVYKRMTFETLPKADKEPF